MIKVEHLFLKYIREYYALYDINLNIKAGEKVAFIGEKESGRTTLLRVIAGLEKFEKGEVYLKDIDIKKVDFKTDVQMGYVPVAPVFFENKSVYENLKYVLEERKINKDEIEKLINKVLIEFNIEKYRNIKAKDLDTYERYLMCFVRLALRPIEILLVDNIFEKLTNDEASAFIELMKSLFGDKNVTLVVVADTYEKVKEICDRKINFVSGSIEQ